MMSYRLKPKRYAMAALCAFALVGSQSQLMQAKERPAPLAVPLAAKDEIVVKLQPSAVTRVRPFDFSTEIFGAHSLQSRDEELVHGEIKVNGEEVSFYVPKDGPYHLTTDEEEYKNTSMRVSVDADEDGKLPDTECWFSSLPIRFADSMFKVRKIDPAGTWITLAKANVPLAGMVVGRPCPDFELLTTEGKKVKASDYKGKTLLLDIWSMT